MKKYQSNEKMKKYSYNNSISRAERNQKYDIKSKTIEIQKPKTNKEILDNYRYLEIKHIRNNDERKKSIVRHRRLGQPIGKETIYEKGRFSTQTNYILKKTNIEMKNERRSNNEKNYKKTMTENPKNYTKEKNNSQYKKSIEKFNNISDINKKQISYSNSKRGQSQEDMHNKRANNQYISIFIYFLIKLKK